MFKKKNVSPIYALRHHFFVQRPVTGSSTPVKHPCKLDFMLTSGNSAVKFTFETTENASREEFFPRYCKNSALHQL